jgi:hypothetical protein
MMPVKIKVPFGEKWQRPFRHKMMPRLYKKVLAAFLSI